MKKLFQNRIKAFTLAEVLVTLAVIGVIAAITIPSLLKDYEVSEHRSRVKTAYSYFSLAFKKMQADNTVPNFYASGTNESLRDEFCNQMNCLQKGRMNEFFAPYYYYYENTSAGYDYSESGAFAAVLNNGMLAIFNNYKNNCTGTHGTLNNICGELFIDTNAKSGPNMFGKDYIDLWIIRVNKKYQILPAGSKDGYDCISPAGTNWQSHGCTSYYILNKELP